MNREDDSFFMPRALFLFGVVAEAVYGVEEHVAHKLARALAVAHEQRGVRPLAGALAQDVYRFHL